MTKVQHLSHAYNSIKLYNQLKSGSKKYWAVIVAFYMALHVVNALLFEKGPIPTNHKATKKLIKKHLVDLLVDYETLKNLGWRARYVATAYFTINEDQIAITDEIIDNVFFPILKREGKSCGMQIV